MGAVNNSGGGRGEWVDFIEFVDLFTGGGRAVFGEQAVHIK